MEDLEDMLSGGNVGGAKKANNYRSGGQKNAKPTGQLDDLDDLDDMLDGLGGNGYQKKAKPTKPQSDVEDIDDLWGGPKPTKPI